MDAGKINKFNLGGIQPKNYSKPAGEPKSSPSVQQNDPTETFSFTGGQAPLLKSEGDSVVSQQPLRQEFAPMTLNTISSSIPTEIGGALIAGSSSLSNTRKSFSGLSLNGLNATSLQTVGGGNIASVNPLQPAAGARVPTTSADAVNSTFGGGPYFYVSGRSAG